MSKNISLEDLNQIKLKKNYDYALHNHLLSETSLSSQVNLKAMYTFSKRVTPRCVVTNQSSRCASN